MSRAGRWVLGWLVVTAPIVIWGFVIVWPVLRQLGDPHRPRSYYIPSASMMPTLAVGDVIRPRLVERTPLRRGMIVVIRGRETARVDRIVGLSGDVVAMRGGVLSLNGRPVQSRFVGAGPMLEGGEASREWWERLPGEAGDHRILKAGASAGDEYGPARVPAGALFLLGDNRDRAADSRFGPDMGGLGFVPVTAVLGIADRLLWGHDRRDLGRPLDGATS